MSTPVLVVVEHDRGDLMPATLEAMTIARDLALAYDVPVEALAVGDVAARTVDRPRRVRCRRRSPRDRRAAHRLRPRDLGGLRHPGRSLARSVDGDRNGNRPRQRDHGGVAARLDAPFAANCIDVRPTEGGADLTRVRWGGSLLEQARLDAETPLVTVAHHSIEPVPAVAPSAAVISSLPVEIDRALTRSMVTGRVERTAGITLATAPVVVGGGRGVGSAEGFGALEKLASTLGGVVGCSRGHQQRLAQPCRPGGPDRYPDRSGRLLRLWHLRRDPALGRGDGEQAHHRHQHRRRCQHGSQGRPRRDRRPARRRPCDHRGDSPPAGLSGRFGRQVSAAGLTAQVPR